MTTPTDTITAPEAAPVITSITPDPPTITPDADLVPEPAPEPVKPTHRQLLACGEVLEVANPIATAHYCETHRATVPVLFVSVIEGRS